MKKALSLIIVLVMVFAMSATAFAAPTDPNLAGSTDGTLPTDDAATAPDEGDGHTTIGIVSTSQKITVDPDGNIEGANIAFEVPLYVVLAVGNNSNYNETTPSYAPAGNGSAGVICPKTYGINNTGTADIAVKTLSFAAYAGDNTGRANTNTWSTVASVNAGTAAKSIALNIGKQLMPTITAGTTAKAKLGVGGTAFAATSDFCAGTAATPKTIAGGASQDYDILGATNKLSFTNATAAPQFQVVYTMGFLGGTGGTFEGKFTDATDVYTYVGSNEIGTAFSPADGAFAN